MALILGEERHREEVMSRMSPGAKVTGQKVPHTVSEATETLGPGRTHSYS